MSIVLRCGGDSYVAVERKELGFDGGTGDVVLVDGVPVGEEAAVAVGGALVLRNYPWIVEVESGEMIQGWVGVRLCIHTCTAV